MSNWVLSLTSSSGSWRTDANKNSHRTIKNPFYLKNIGEILSCQSNSKCDAILPVQSGLKYQKYEHYKLADCHL